MKSVILNILKPLLRGTACKLPHKSLLVLIKWNPFLRTVLTMCAVYSTQDCVWRQNWVLSLHMLSTSICLKSSARSLAPVKFAVGQTRVWLKVLEPASCVCTSLLKWRLLGLTCKVVVRNKRGKIICALLCRVLGQCLVHSQCSVQGSKNYFSHSSWLLIVLKRTWPEWQDRPLRAPPRIIKGVNKQLFFLREGGLWSSDPEGASVTRSLRSPIQKKTLQSSVIKVPSHLWELDRRRGDKATVRDHFLQLRRRNAQPTSSDF